MDDLPRHSNNPMGQLGERQPILQRSSSPQGKTPSAQEVNRLSNSESHESTSKEI